MNLDTTSRGLARMERSSAGAGCDDGTLVLLVHGSMDRAASFRRVMRHLLGLATVDDAQVGEELCAG